MRIAYKALDQSGVEVADTIEAPSATDAVEALRREGYLVIDVQEAGRATKKRRGSRRAVALKAGHMKGGELLFFTRQMAMLLKSGSPVVPALKSIGLQLKGAARPVVERIRQDMEQGHPLAESMKQFPDTFSPVYVAVIGAGEMTASLGEMFERLAAWVNYRREIRNRVLAALVYPLLLISLCVIIVTAMVSFVVPRFKDLFETLGAQLPVSTEIMFSISFFIRDYWIALTGSGTAVILTLLILSRCERGKQWYADLPTRLPFAGRLFVRLLQAQVFRMMGLLLESRVGIMETMRLARQISRNSDFKRLCTGVCDELERGGKLSAALGQSPIVSPSIAQAISTGEESGHLDQALLFVADVLDEENVHLIGAMTKLLEPVILIGMGVIVGCVALSLFIPLFDLAAMAQ